MHSKDVSIAPTRSKANTSIQLITHRDSGAKMEDTVVLYVYGYEGKVGPLVLGSGEDGLFQPGAEDQMKVWKSNMLLFTRSSASFILTP